MTKRERFTLTPAQMEFRWERILEGLRQWEPKAGSKHVVLLVAFGMARKLEIPRSRAEADLHPIVARWETNDTTQEAIKKHADSAYDNDDEDQIAYIYGLRAMGVTVNLKGQPGPHPRANAA